MPLREPCWPVKPERLPDPVPLTGCPYKSNPYPLYERMRGPARSTACFSPAVYKPGSSPATTPRTAR